MPRELRAKAAGLVHHVVHRGINRQAIFRDVEDCHIFLRIMSKAAEKHGLGVMAYCLMKNHHHLMIEDHNAKLSEAMHYLNGTYTTAFNQRHQCEGALLRGRFYSSPVLDDRYEMVLFRYIHLNPVKAGIATCAESYPWSSFQSYIGAHQPYPVTQTRILKKLERLGISLSELTSWMAKKLPSLDPICDPEGLKNWVARTNGKVAKKQHKRKFWNSPLLSPTALADSSTQRPQSKETQREALLVALCSDVAEEFGVDLHALVSPSMFESKRGYEARSAAALRCQAEHRASHAELAQLLCLSVKSIHSVLTRAKA